MQEKSQLEQSQHQQESRGDITTIERRTEKLLRINADDYSTKHLVIFWVLYVAMVIAISLLTLALPPTFVSIKNSDELAGTALAGCPNPSGFDANNMVICNQTSFINPTAGLLLRQMSNKNQFFFVYMNFILQNNAQTIVQIAPTTIQLQYYEIGEKVTPNGVEFYKINEIQNVEAQFGMISYESQRIYDPNGYSLRGFRKFFGYQKYIEQQNSLILFTFKKWPTNNIKEIYMDVSTVTPQFTLFSILIRYILFGISLGTTIAYYLRYRLIPENLRTLEQKMILYLSIFTVMFNDPLYAATILAPNGFTAFLSVAFVVNFLTFLMAFWMIFMDRIYYESGQQYQNVINKKKIAYFVVFYIALFVLQFQLALLRFSDSPMIIGDEMKSGGIIAFEVISFLIYAAGLIYISVQFIRSVMNFFNKIWRNQIFLMFSFLFIVIIVVMLIIDGFSVYEYTGNRILILFGFMNMYTIFLQYMFSINTQQAKKLDKQRILGGDMDRNQVETIVSHFGNDEIMVDLDSQVGEIGKYHQNNIHKSSTSNVNKYPLDINERLQSRDQSEMEEQTEDNLNNFSQGNKKQPEVYSLED